MELSKLQNQCIDNIISWYTGSNTKQTFVLSGVAGSGKTTLIAHIRNLLSKNIKIAFCSYTGKAASVLRSKLQKCGINNFENDSISTIHSLIYEPPTQEDDYIDEMNWILKSELDYDFLIVDECSMVPQQIYDELLSFKKKILFVGDAFQLPPVADDFNLLSNHIDFKLHEVHRFALENPLTKVSIMARETGYIPHGKYGNTVIKVPKKHSLITEFIKNTNPVFSDTVILTGFNATRIELNQKIRNWFGYKGKYPNIGERLICLRNNKNALKCPIYNGVGGNLISLSEQFDHLVSKIKIDGEEQPFIGKISKNTFGNKNPDMTEFIIDDSEEEDVDKIARFLKNKSYIKKNKKTYLNHFDFGAAITVHKSQGSEWSRVMLIEQPCQFWSGDLWNRWLYTGITRSTTELLIVR